MVSSPLGLEPRPQSLFCGHTVVGEKAAGSERSCSQNADPACAFCTHQRVEYKIKPDCGSKRQQRACELPGRESEKDGLPVFPDLFGNFYFDTDPSLLLQSHQFLDDSVAHTHSSHQHQQVEDEFAHITPNSSYRRYVGIHGRRGSRHHRKDDAGQCDDSTFQTHSCIAAEKVLAHIAGRFTRKGGPRNGRQRSVQ